MRFRLRTDEGSGVMYDVAHTFSSLVFHRGPGQRSAGEQLRILWVRSVKLEVLRLSGCSVQLSGRGSKP